MDVENIRNIAVVGVGEIGHQIAQEFAMAGYRVSLHDTSDEKIRQAQDNIRRNLGFLIGSGFMASQQAETVMPRIKGNLVLKEAVHDADIVVEAVYENVALKQQIFRELDQLCPERTILASNSSTLMPKFMASATKRPDKVLVTHYINPPFLLPVVELVRCKETSNETVKTMHDLYTKMGKTPVVVQKEVPGFIVNRLQIAMCREALHIVEQGIASPQDVDRVIKDSFGRRLSTIGVFDFMDGDLELILAGFSNVLPDLSNASEVSPLIKEKVEKGELGWKSGKGFYEWTPETVDALRKRLVSHLVEIAKWNKSEDTMGKATQEPALMVGTWRLLSCESRRADGSGEVMYPFGRDPQGSIVYTDSGRFSVHLMRRGRLRSVSNDQLRLTPDELKSSWDGYTAYYGHYTVDRENSIVYHNVEGSMFPNWEGQKLKRFYKVSGNRLELTTTPTAFGGEMVAILTWERIG